MRRAPSPPWIVVVAASSGGMQALTALVAGLSADLPAAVLVASHTPAFGRRQLARILSGAGPLPASYPDDGQVLETGRIYVAPPDRHLAIEGRRLRLTTGEKEHRMRPAADVLFRSAAREFGAHSIGIVLSGGGYDGAAGLAAIQARGGISLVQVPRDARLATMPLNALATVLPDACVPAKELGLLVAGFTRGHTARDPGPVRKPVFRNRRRPRARTLKGLRVFVAEDEYLIATELRGMLHGLECRTVGPVADVETGLQVLRRERGQLDCAVLDVDLRGQMALPLASKLRAQGVPLLFATGYGKAVLPEEWACVPRLQKPYDTASLGQAIKDSLRMRWPAAPSRPSTAPDIAAQETALKDSRNLLMRSRVLMSTASSNPLVQSREVLRRTHERLTESMERQKATRRILRSWPMSSWPRKHGADREPPPGEAGEATEGGEAPDDAPRAGKRPRRPPRSR
jgi:DNA-binding LytR/AlgR family response regulator